MKQLFGSFEIGLVGAGKVDSLGEGWDDYDYCVLSLIVRTEQ